MSEPAPQQNKPWRCYVWNPCEFCKYWIIVAWGLGAELIIVVAGCFWSKN